MSVERETLTYDDLAVRVQKGLELGLARFEEWVALQRAQDGEFGKVARFVLVDRADGCWPSTRSMPRGAFYGTDEELEVYRRHLIAEHNLRSSSFQTFQQVFEHFTQENNSEKKGESLESGCTTYCRKP